MERRILRSTKRRRIYEVKNDEKAENGEIDDMLSNFPDGILLHILSFLDAKYAVQTCVLSTRWRNLWKLIPTLILHSSKFSTLKQFSKFVPKILTLRDTSISLHALDLDRHGHIEPRILKKILDYVCSHNTHLQKLEISLRGDHRLIMRTVSSCHALTSLKLSVWNRGGSCDNSGTRFPKSLNLPSLTNLNLKEFIFSCGENNCAEPFFGFTKLNSLVIDCCSIWDAKTLKISSETLVNLTMHKNIFYIDKIELSTSSLCTFTYTDCFIPRICGTGLASVKQFYVVVTMGQYLEKPGMVLRSWLLDLANVTSLTISSTTLQILSLVPELLELKLPSLCNLKSMEIKLEPLERSRGLFNKVKDEMLKKIAAKSMKQVFELRRAGLKPPPIPDGIVAFLLQNSPSAKVHITTKYPDIFKIKQVVVKKFIVNLII
ncbi:putative F-box domain, leucine-rich repeat domain, L domain-containing protein [Medicago truncatula]|uniref:Putative F-box domain, leucine-rich repeat domain, L domain-containing protein n=1 Tax=Medicago truncatula TaxID=3880 RepID=A0A396HQF3_MEDTR|nr:putative F-box domain, leucine-rich repeat domain, L domain-containing protein [Medicago truncatula]